MCMGTWDLWFHFLCSPSPIEVSPHLRGYAAHHRGMLEGDLHKELANCRLVALKAVSNATMNWRRQRRTTDVLRPRHLFDRFFHSVLFVTWGEKMSACRTALRGFAHTVSNCLGSALCLHFKTSAREDLNLCQINSDHSLSNLTEKKSPGPFLAFQQQHLRTGYEKKCFQWGLGERDVNAQTQLELGPATSTAPEELHLSPERMASPPSRWEPQLSNHNTS